jgi:hypothetical protein
VRFETGPDGRVTVHLREGDAEISRTYASQDELKQQAPKLFERFRAMQDRLR